MLQPCLAELKGEKGLPFGGQQNQGEEADGEAGSQWKVRERKERSLRLSSNSEEGAGLTRVLVRWGSKARLPKVGFPKAAGSRKS